MSSIPRTPGCAVCVDMGTTNTRVWMVHGSEILARAQAGVGVRDTARDGSPNRIRATLRELIAEVRQQTSKSGLVDASFVVAAGMITSALGLVEVPHISTPAGAEELAGAVQRHQFPDITNLPILLVPGVRSGLRTGDLDAVVQSDVMRGEETLAVGLVAMGHAHPPVTVLNLGSHWKAIQLDDRGRIESSITSISGELIQAVQTQTILASAIPSERPRSIDLTWCQAGMREQRRSGLPRALFCVRLLELGGNGTPEERLSFLVGAFVAADLDALIARRALSMESTVLICGGGAVAEAWRHALDKVSIPARTMNEAEIEAALLAGLRCVLELTSRLLLQEQSC